ncbi:peptidase T [Gemmobacter serpentinus]|uniref:peptidase T n=1 Tax=Gemmobacter serpentinus TaxID=2652247 RepID=UPI00124E6805|nr:peptidase T [Gemmobacter serpentinus]
MTQSPDIETELETRLLRYTAIDSQSDEDSPSQPSTAIQLDMARLLVAELSALGASDVHLTDYGAVLATIPGTSTGPRIGFVAHMDTAPAFAASGVKPVVHRRYNGGAISFADAPGLVLSPEVSPYLGTKIGHDIITASGTTLLGADDKAGVAILMALAGQLLAQPGLARPDLAHPTIRIAFTPDEEIGRGVDPRLPTDLGVDFAYTLDGGAVGEIEYESFSADGAVVKITGVSTHPGTAKGKMVNAATLAGRLIAFLPQATLTPEVTEGREGFIHLHDIRGGAAEAELRFILRDFELDGLAQKADVLRSACAALQVAEPRAAIQLEIRPQYRNMRYWLEKDMTPVDLARAACRAEGIEPVSVPIRGGTDGSRLTEMGVPCPNVFTGMQEIHGPLEWISVQDMAQSLRVCLRLVQEAARA